MRRKIEKHLYCTSRSLGKKNPQHWEKKIMKRKKFPQPLLHKLQRMGEIQILMVC
jgi:hypothetical protein